MKTSAAVLFVWSAVSATASALHCLADTKCSILDDVTTTTWSVFDGTSVTKERTGCVPGEKAPWVMMNAYVAGSGIKGKTWIDVKTKKDRKRCMTNWTYYNEDATVILSEIADVQLYNNTMWCPLRVYIPKEGSKWKERTWATVASLTTSARHASTPWTSATLSTKCGAVARG